jgi:hypothetical protein
LNPMIIFEFQNDVGEKDVLLKENKLNIQLKKNSRQSKSKINLINE